MLIADAVGLPLWRWNLIPLILHVTILLCLIVPTTRRSKSTLAIAYCHLVTSGLCMNLIFRLGVNLQV